MMTKFTGTTAELNGRNSHINFARIFGRTALKGGDLVTVYDLPLDGSPTFGRVDAIKGEVEIFARNIDPSLSDNLITSGAHGNDIEKEYDKRVNKFLGVSQHMVAHALYGGFGGRERTLASLVKGDELLWKTMLGLMDIKVEYKMMSQSYEPQIIRRGLRVAFPALANRDGMDMTSDYGLGWAWLMTVGRSLTTAVDHEEVEDIDNFVRASLGEEVVDEMVDIVEEYATLRTRSGLDLEDAVALAQRWIELLGVPEGGADNSMFGDKSKNEAPGTPDKSESGQGEGGEGDEQEDGDGEGGSGDDGEGEDDQDGDGSGDGDGEGDDEGDSGSESGASTDADGQSSGKSSGEGKGDKNGKSKSPDAKGNQTKRTITGSESGSGSMGDLDSTEVEGNQKTIETQGSGAPEKSAREIDELLSRIMDEAEAKVEQTWDKETPVKLSDPQELANEVFSPAIGANKEDEYGHRNWRFRDPTPEEDSASVALARRLERMTYSAPDVIKTATALPPGRLRSREALQGVAQRSMGMHPTTTPWERKKRRHSETPTLTIGLATDTSVSMSWAEEMVASAAYVFGTAVPRIGGRFASVTFGAKAEAVVKPGERPTKVAIRESNGPHEAFDEAAASLEGVLRFTTTRTGAKMLVIVSDAQLVRAGEMAKMREWTQRFADAGVAQVWVMLPGDKKGLEDKSSYIYEYGYVDKKKGIFAPGVEMISITAKAAHDFHTFIDPLADAMQRAFITAQEMAR